MPIATMTSKGQFTMPKEVRDDLGLVAGSRVMFVKLPNGSYTLVPKTGKITDIFGMLHSPGMPVMSIDDMNEAIAEGAAQGGVPSRLGPAR